MDFYGLIVCFRKLMLRCITVQYRNVTCLFSLIIGIDGFWTSSYASAS